MSTIRTYVRDGRSPIPSSDKTSQVMSANRGKNTSPEVSLRKSLWRHGIRGYRIHQPGLPGRPDIVFPKKRLVIMVNGCFWHRCPFCKPSVPKTNVEFWERKFERNVKRDAKDLEELRALGWRTMVIWECSIRSNVDEVVKRIRDEMGMT